MSMNIWEFLFSGPLYIGTPQQGGASNILYDTSAGFLAVTSTSCEDNCYTEFYDPAISTTYASTSNTVSTMSFPNSPKFRGDTLVATAVSDTVCFSTDDTSCVSDYQFFNILSENV